LNDRRDRARERKIKELKRDRQTERYRKKLACMEEREQDKRDG
jgi:hypothetical protein